jgi:pyruvate dehydrogenase E1 component alpha subunit/2-oxoisovalerate dehydrogenase E1 component alpha subunit
VGSRPQKGKSGARKKATGKKPASPSTRKGTKKAAKASGGKSAAAAAKSEAAARGSAAKKRGGPARNRGAAKQAGGSAPGGLPGEVPSAGPIELVRILGEDGRLVSGAELPCGEEKILELFQGMLRVRVTDTRMLNLQRQGRIGFYGQCTGQEAAIIGSAAAIEEDDWVVPALREAGVAMYLGLPFPQMIAQLAGKAAEISKGRQMPCHHSFRAGHFVSMSSVIGTQIPHAAGIARAAQIRGDRCAVLGYLGDGATSASDFHSGLNFAAVWKSPVVFFCQNNQWAISVPFEKQTASASVAAKAGAYGMPGLRVDGNDALAVFQVTRDALRVAREGGGPALVEALTYRRLGHSSSDDPDRYRDPAEVAAWERRDPIERLRTFLRAKGLLDPAAEEAMEEEIHQQISDAVREVEKMSDPDPSSLVEDVFAEVTPQLREQREGLLGYIDRQSG